MEPRACSKKPASFWKDVCERTSSKTDKFSIRFFTRRQSRIVRALHGDREVQRRAGDLSAAVREGPDDAGRFELRFELDRSQPQNLLASHGDRRLRLARTLDRQLERLDGIRDHPGAHFRGSRRTHERQGPLTMATTE